MIAASRQWVRTFASWLSLAVVLTCALCSFGSPVRASSGSAFNAFTSDVAIGPSRAGAPERDRKEQIPPSGGADPGTTAALASAALVAPAAPAAVTGFARTFLRHPLVSAGPVGARAPPLP